MHQGEGGCPGTDRSIDQSIVVVVTEGAVSLSLLCILFVYLLLLLSVCGVCLRVFRGS